MVDDQQPVVLEKHNNAAEIVKNIKNKWGFFWGGRGRIFLCMLLENMKN